MKLHCSPIPYFVIVVLLIVAGCSSSDPQKEDTPELITKVTLTFTPAGGGTAIVGTATDPDGQGSQSITVDGPINLAANKSYILTIQLINGLAQPTDAAYNVTDEVRREGFEHQFFFSWTNNIFSSPEGNGNIDNSSDIVNYSGGDDARDVNHLPLGLTTLWTTATGTATSSFRVLLKHQPDLKSATSDSNTGETDLDVTFTINAQ